MSSKCPAPSLSAIALALLLTSCGRPAPVRTAVVRALPRAVQTTPEYTISAGAIHVFRLDLPPGTFADLAVDQHGADVKVSVDGPDGRLAASDSNFGSWVPEPVPFIARRPGPYRLEVRLPDAPSGRYAVRVAALRPATPRDRDRVAAEALFAWSEELRRRGDRPSLIAAVETGRKALAGFQALGEHGREAAVLYSLAWASVDLDRLEEALAFDNQALALFRAQGREREEVWTLSLLGLIHRYQGDTRRALELYDEALARSQRLGERWAQAASLQGLGMVRRSLGETDQAIARYQQALDLWRALGNRRREATTLSSLGELYQVSGEPETGLAHLESALAIFTAKGDAQEQARTLISMGGAYSRMGQWQKGIQTLESALDIEKRLDDLHGQAQTLNDLGCASIRLDSRRAGDYFAHARALFQEIGDQPSEAVALANVARASLEQGRPREAIATYAQALPRLAALGDRGSEASALLGLAQGRRDLGDLAGARAAVEEGIALIESLRGASASQVTRVAFLASHQDFYAFEIGLLMEMHRRSPGAGWDARALEVSERARARGLLDLLAESQADLRHGVDPALLVRMDAADHRVDEAERRRRLAGAGAPSAELEAAERELRQALAEQERVQIALRLASPGYAALTHPLPLSVPEIQRQVLDGDTLLLEYALGTQRSFLWALTKTGPPRTIELPPRAEIEALARRAYGELSSRQTTQTRIPAERTMGELSRYLLGPVAGLLGHARLLVVSDGALGYLPFAALPSPGTGEPLVAGHEVVTSPSASALAVQRRELAGRRPAPKALAVVADPVFDSADPRVAGGTAAASLASRGASPEGDRFKRLPYSREEAEGLLGLVPPEERLSALGFDASRETVLSGRLAQYRIVHFATHGVLDLAHPELSRLVLSQVDERGRPRAGSVRTRELYALRLPAELVVLSACRTALGREIRGEGLVGITRGFQYAGARSVLVSLWEVDDQATAELMRLFYREMLERGQAPSAALRAAQEALHRQRRWQPPYFWAGFTLQGDWRVGAPPLNQSAPPGSTQDRPEPRGFSRRTP